jgi:hypothetical protein
MKVGRITAYAAAAAMMLIVQSATAANLLRNGSFEQTPCATPCSVGAVVAPAEWLQRDNLPGATFSNDGSYGLPPDSYSIFNGVTAQDGIRWVGVYSYIDAGVGQLLTEPLVPGATYTISAYVRPASRTDLFLAGKVQFELWNSTSGTDALALGAVDMPASANWELRTLTFKAPAQAAAYPMLFFRAIKNRNSGEIFPGIDNVSLVKGTGADDGGGGGGGSCSAAGAIVINGCDTGVPNVSTSGSCAAGLVLACSATAKNHGDYVSCVAHLTDNLVSLNLITGQQKGSIQSCVARFGTP